MEEYLTVLAAAEYLGVSRDKVSRMINSGQLTAKIDALDSRQKLITRAQLDEIKNSSGHVIKYINPKTKAL
jgi:excisionase family DNA binding protein